MSRKFTKAEANYRLSTDPDEQCQTCVHFFVLNGFGRCGVVEGLIEPNHVSNFWEADFFPAYTYEGVQGSLRRV